jgi:hypothetical protein
MIIAFIAFIGLVIMTFMAWFTILFDGSKLQPSWREILLRRCDEQHAAILRGNDHLGIYGNYPPAEL